jgi:hypothetical protein
VVQVNSARQSATTPRIVGKISPIVERKLGNSVALNVKGGGVGTGRTVYPQGSQSKPGPTRDANASGRDILRDFGPDFKR